MKNDKDNEIIELTFNLSLKIIKYAEELRNLKKHEMSSQIFKCGTSIGANIREAQSTESKSDFIHKFKIAAKEADELEYWLLLCEKSEIYPNPLKELKSDLESIIKVISKIITTSKRTQLGFKN